VDLDAVLQWDQAGPVAILLLVLLTLATVTRWLLRQLIASKDAQITRALSLNDKLVDEVGETLDAILTALKETRPKRGTRT
jgi:hypothetical protein